MNYPYAQLPTDWYWIAAILYALLLIPTLWSAPWSRFRQADGIHVFMGSCISLMILWQISTNAIPGLNYHFLGATLLTLMFGWQLALLAFSMVFIGLVLNGHGDWQALPLNILVMGMLPIMLSHGLFRLVDRRLPNHFFIYVFINGFFGAALCLLLTLLCASALLILAGVYTYTHLSHAYFPFLPLMLFPEAFLTGMLVSIMAAFTPSWVCTFDDSRYLHGK